MGGVVVGKGGYMAGVDGWILWRMGREEQKGRLGDGWATYGWMIAWACEWARGVIGGWLDDWMGVWWMVGRAAGRGLD